MWSHWWAGTIQPKTLNQILWCSRTYTRHNRYQALEIVQQSSEAGTTTRTQWYRSITPCRKTNQRNCSSQQIIWFCPKCIEQILPFTHIVEEEDFLPAILTLDHDLCSFNYNNADVFLPFDLSEEKSNLSIYERDPDINFYAGVNISVGNNCNYYHLAGPSIKVLLPWRSCFKIAC